jgi:hypothetical protein
VFPGSFKKFSCGDDVVALENGSGSVAGHHHCYSLKNPCADRVPYRGPRKVMRDFAWNADVFASAFPGPPKLLNRLSLPAENPRANNALFLQPVRLPFWASSMAWSSLVNGKIRASSFRVVPGSRRTIPGMKSVAPVGNNSSSAGDHRRWMARCCRTSTAGRPVDQTGMLAPDDWYSGHSIIKFS